MRSFLTAPAVAALALALALAAACGGGTAADGGSLDSDSVGDGDPIHIDAAADGSLDGAIDGASGELDVFSAAVTDVSLEIDYETGEQPYTGPILGFGDTFDTTVSNLDRLFARKKTLHIPRTTATMQDIGPIADAELTVADLLAIADAHRDQLDSPTHKSYYLLFVNGYFADASGPRPNILGISLGHTGVIAMFKDVIASTNSITNPNTSRYVEQSTIVHEVAHAVGLVNNGIPLTSAHQDAPHGAHCTNDRCVMYYTNEGAADATQFALTYVLSGSSILFDAACLADADALTGGL